MSELNGMYITLEQLEKSWVQTVFACTQFLWPSFTRQNSPFENLKVFRISPSHYDFPKSLQTGSCAYLYCRDACHVRVNSFSWACIHLPCQKVDSLPMLDRLVELTTIWHSYCMIKSSFLFMSVIMFWQNHDTRNILSICVSLLLLLVYLYAVLKNGKRSFSGLMREEMVQLRQKITS